MKGDERAHVGGGVGGNGIPAGHVAFPTAGLTNPLGIGEMGRAGEAGDQPTKR